MRSCTCGVGWAAESVGDVGIKGGAEAAVLARVTAVE